MTNASSSDSKSTSLGQQNYLGNVDEAPGSWDKPVPVERIKTPSGPTAPRVVGHTRIERSPVRFPAHFPQDTPLDVVYAQWTLSHALERKLQDLPVSTTRRDGRGPSDKDQFPKAHVRPYHTIHTLHYS